MPDPQLKRKLKKREQSRLRILNKKNEGNNHLFFNLYYVYSYCLLISITDASDKDEQEIASQEEDVVETERKFNPDKLKQIKVTNSVSISSASKETENKFKKSH